MEYRVSVQLHQSKQAVWCIITGLSWRTEDFETDEGILDAIREQLAEILSDERDAEENEIWRKWRLTHCLEQTKESWLEEARGVARKLLASKPYITIDDVTAECPLLGYYTKIQSAGIPDQRL